MPYALSLEDKSGYRHARVTGTNSREAVLGYTQQIYETCLARNRRMVLIEENLAGPSLPMASVYQVVDARVAQRSPRSRRLPTWRSIPSTTWRAWNSRKTWR